jgi:hypothetical protein
MDDQAKCKDCGGGLHPIKILDKGHLNWQEDLEYVLPDAKRRFWTSKFPVAGRVEALICDGCGRITLYGVEKEK